MNPARSIPSALVLILALTACDASRGRRSGPGGGTSSDPSADARTDAAIWDGAGRDSEVPRVDGGASSDTGPAARDAGSSSRDAENQGRDAEPEPDSGVAAVPMCIRGCASPSDCVTLGSPLYTKDHYACAGGVCEYLGCRLDAECREAFRDNAYACRMLPPFTIPTCQKTCSSPSDCAGPSPLIDADNYRCSGGTCEWLGCNSSSECDAAYGNGTYACVAASAGFAIRFCQKRCILAADCAVTTAAYDADNYACVSGICEWRGCNSAAECQQSFNDTAYVCR